MKEIGSEYWGVSPVDSQKVYLLSGRTALEFIIRDILNERMIESVLLPSYCCHTMIEPFLRHDIKVRFYDVFKIATGLAVELPEPRNNEIFYYMTYFGFNGISGIDLANIRHEYSVIIEDRTHSWLQGDNQCKYDYSYASFRKWTGFSGLAVAEKKQGSFFDCPSAIHESYCSMREKAAAMKKAYIEHGKGDKQEFLSLFNEAEELLETDYVGYRPTNQSLISFLSLDRRQMIERRRENAAILIDGLKDIPGVDLIFSQLDVRDVPLFVPILIQEGYMGLRKHLISHQVYCPVHWPLSDLHEGLSGRAKEIYTHELSLVCDQRYDKKDMSCIVRLIQEYFKR